MADLATQPDQIQVRGVVGRRREDPLQISVRLLNVHLGRSKPDSTRHPVDVGVHWEGWSVKRELQDDSRGLGTNPSEFEQPLPGILDRQFLQESEIQSAPFLSDFPKHLLNPRALLVGQAGGPDGRNYRGWPRITDSLPGRKTALQRPKRAVAILVVRVLREDSGYELIYRRQRIPPGRTSVSLKQSGMNRPRQAPGLGRACPIFRRRPRATWRGGISACHVVLREKLGR
jgi:hypothetical protein